jgi:hypothetical protein
MTFITITHYSYACVSARQVKLADNCNVLYREQGFIKVIRVAASNLNGVDNHCWINKGSQILKGFSSPRLVFFCFV